LNDAVNREPAPLPELPALSGLSVMPADGLHHPDRLNARGSTLVFLAFAAAYFCSALLRANSWMPLAGRALSGFNLVIFAGVFVAQWGLGLLVDTFSALGLAQVASFQAALAVFLCCCIAAYGYFISVKADNSPQ
jgi:hypothetical protein